MPVLHLPPHRSLRPGRFACAWAVACTGIALLVLAVSPLPGSQAAWPPLAVLLAIGGPRLGRALADARQARR